MDDLSSVEADRARRPSARNGGAFEGLTDRTRGKADLALWLLLAGCAAAPSRGPAAAPPPELWCDASAPRGGDGSRAHPLRALPAELGPGLRVHARSGVYAGPLRLGPGASLTGHGVVVVAAAGPGPVVVLSGGALRQLSVQGGEVGVEAEGAVVLEDVHFSGHRVAALRARPGAAVAALRLEVEGTIPGSDGLLAEGAALEVTRARFAGGLRRAVALRGGTAALQGLGAEGPATLLHAVDAEVSLRDASASGGVGPAVFAAGGRLRVERLAVVGHEYALQASRGRVEVRGLTSRGAQRAGVALHRTSGLLQAVEVERAGDEGGLHLDEAHTTLEDVAVRGAASWGVLVRLGTADVSRLVVEAVRAEASGGPAVLGDGLVVRDAELDGGVVRVRDADGAGLLATAGARVRLEALQVERTQGPGAQVERGASLRLGRLEVMGAFGPALVASEAGRAEVGVLGASGVEGAVWADCETGASVAVGALGPRLEQPPSRCVRLGP